MGAVTQSVGTRTSVTVTGFSTLASGAYCVSDAITFNTNKPGRAAIEVSAETTNAPAGGFRVDVFLQISLDGTNYTSGPTSGTTTTDEPDLIQIGTVPINSSTTTHRETFEIGRILGFIPYSAKVVLKNNIGVALTSGTVFVSEISDSVA